MTAVSYMRLTVHKRVDLPQPEGPMKEVMRLEKMLREMSWSA